MYINMLSWEFIVCVLPHQQGSYQPHVESGSDTEETVDDTKPADGAGKEQPKPKEQDSGQAEDEVSSEDWYYRFA